MNHSLLKSLAIAGALAFGSVPLHVFAVDDSDTHSAGEVLDDTLITTKVKAGLVGDPITKAHQISVDTYKGTVKLSGYVDTAEAKHRAVQIARATKGALVVEDDLTVRP
ncbi:MAG: BON domain-containing protein [Gammaproteobacteria bacterium]|nr:BON domain-containing protein [Gammaproteobacteria bacterium]MBI5619171.1 BON domain-containing protein [Gammaproteobacteria bacterium]